MTAAVTDAQETLPPPAEETPLAAGLAEGTWGVDPPMAGEAYYGAPAGPVDGWGGPEHGFWGGLHDMGFRSSATHGRFIGLGSPLQGTSWLNRPYELSLETGAFVMTRDLTDQIERQNAGLFALHVGWDFDYYWGTQFRTAWASPEFGDGDAASSGVLLSDLSLMYYPWGDSRVRPYYRWGLGLTELEYHHRSGTPFNESLLTMPVGVGVKYQAKRWFAFRAEAVDNIAFGQNQVETLHNLTLTFGFECRFGGRPANTWGRTPGG